LSTRREQRSRLFLAAALAALVLCAGCGAPSGPAAGVESPGHSLFRRHCASCHAPDGAGGEVGSLRVPSLREGRPLQYTDRQLFEQISKGSSRGMPPFSYTLTDEQMRLLARFVREEIQGRR
jgi:cytochrome c oxidase cbb3-type subunit III